MNELVRRKILNGKVNVLIVPMRFVANKGPILSPENLLKKRLMISITDSFTLLTTSGSPPTAFRISSDNQVLRLFL